MIILKTVFITIVTAIVIAIASLPLLAGNFLWNWVNPVTEMGRIVFGSVLLLTGGGITFFIWFALFMVWSALVAGALSVKDY